MRVLVLLLVLSFAMMNGQVPGLPVQPLPFSHKAHAAAGMACASCHPNAEPGRAMGTGKAQACMECHRTVKAKSPAIQELAAIVKKKQDVSWVRVYQVPGFVRFSHRSHGAAGVVCETCHGPVATRDRLLEEKPTTQKACLACHTPRGIGLRADGKVDCFFCHD